MEYAKPLNWEKLEDDFKNERSVVLFLGAGIDFGAPHGIDYSWDSLLNHLLKYAVMQMLPSDNLGKQVASEMSSSAKKLCEELTDDENQIDENSLKEKVYELKEQIDFDSQFPRDVKSTIVKQTMGNEAYVKLIQDFLYGKMGKNDIIEAGEKYVGWLNDKAKTKPDFFSLFSVADMVLSNHNIRAVVTQNYDQFLCEAICFLQNNTEYNNFVMARNQQVRQIIPNTICEWKGRSDFNYKHLNIYHVHGFIPRYDEIQAPKDNKIVLSLDEFYEDSRNVYSWQIASQLHFLSQYTCIFCGLSLDDYTNQRLLHYVKGKHHGNLYYIAASHSNEKKRIKDSVKNKFHENNGLTVLYDEQGYGHIYQLLGELRYGTRK
jgi:hypothetical protein